MKIIAFTKHGKKRPDNEDRIVVGQSILAEGAILADIDSGSLAVLDGVGGNKAGAVASAFVANKLSTLPLVTKMELQNINRQLLALADSSEQYKGMAATLSGIQIHDNCVTMFHIGNSRIYMLKEGDRLEQMTRDDTMLNYLLDAGQLTPENAHTFPKRHQITACLGGGSESLCDIKISSIPELQVPVMITSDGIHDHLTDEQMQSIISQYGLTVKACGALIDAARENGSVDDISILFATP